MAPLRSICAALIVLSACLSARAEDGGKCLETCMSLCGPESSGGGAQGGVETCPAPASRRARRGASSSAGLDPFDPVHEVVVFDEEKAEAESDEGCLPDGRVEGEVIVAQSLIPNAGLGIFANRSWDEGDTIMLYTGKILYNVSSEDISAYAYTSVEQTEEGVYPVIVDSIYCPNVREGWSGVWGVGCGVCGVEKKRVGQRADGTERERQRLTETSFTRTRRCAPPRGARMTAMGEVRQRSRGRHTDQRSL